ncbi:C-terminal processing protease CtpA/Prc [Saonia flava]|uniref:C-terminal processing protease CtpA/Prc n=1 Tax=Saonia flava TaxID=523696 RepID=A0A846QVI7_9FLAO|nr:S41 family peptidase [Saonia flava]NJB72008.1 C-terminal processing protease CtpA/Prc [Saonia flava]
MKKYILLFISASILFMGCKKNDDDLEPGGQNPDPNANVDIEDFVWKSMNLWYFWQEEVSDLSDTRFSSSEEYTVYLQGFDSPESFFYDDLLFSDDRFSFLTDDYETLLNSFAGISKSDGLEYGLIRFNDSDDVFGYVRYIVPNSDASTKDISRGDLFTGVDGQTLTINNYVELLFGDNDTYTLNMAAIENNVITPNDKEVTLTKMEGLVENPVFIAKSFDINGNKIGYLMYNRFTSNFDEELNNAFGQFKSDGVTDLVLDMRYNPGGSVNSSRLLASMVYGTNTNDLYIRQRWNNKVQSELSSEQLDDYFANQTGEGSPINTLNLNKVYVLATGSSASASELVMNGLAPYVDIVHIGETTRGKNEFSITLVDNPSNSYVYNSSKENGINPENSYGIQPLVGRNENADGFFDYTTGLVPQIELEEDLADLGILGDINEPLLARAIQEITGVSGKRDFTVKMPVKDMTNSKMFTLSKDNMYLDKELNINLNIQ